MVKIKEIDENLSQMSGLFWGVAMQGGKRYAQKVVTPFHISMAALEPGSAGEEDVGNGYVTVWLGIKGFDYLLCTLKHDSVFNVALDYELDVGEELDLHINGKGTVYLTGYLRVENDPPMEDWEDYDENGEQEELSGSDSMFLDSEDDEDSEQDQEESEEESDDEIVPIQKRKKGGVKIVELEDSPPKKPKKGEAPKPKEQPKGKKNAKEAAAAKVEVIEAPNANANAKKKKKKNKNKKKTNEVAPADKSAPTEAAAAAVTESSNAPGNDAAAVTEKSEKTEVAVEKTDAVPENATNDAVKPEAAVEKTDVPSEKVTNDAVKTEADSTNDKKDANVDAADVPMETTPSVDAVVDAVVDAGLKDIRQEVDSVKEAAAKDEGVPVDAEKPTAVVAESGEAPAVAEATVGEEAKPTVNGVEEISEPAADVIAPAVAAPAADEDSIVVGESKSAKKKKNKKNKNKSLNESEAASDVNGNKKRAISESEASKSPESTPAKKNKPDDGNNGKTTKLPGGLVIREEKEGDGEVAKKGAVCMIKYTGRLKSNNKVFDSNARPNESPLKMVLGKKDVIDGFDEGVQGMKVGGKRRLIIPPHKAYGKQSPSKDIPPNSALIFDVELVKMISGKKK